MSKRTKEELEALKVAEEFNGSVQCNICGTMLQNWEEMSNHWELKHSNLEEVKEELSSIDTLEFVKNWKNDRAKDLLLKNPKLLEIVNRSPQGDEILEKAVNDSLLKEALNYEIPSSLNILALAYQKKDSPQSIESQIQKILEKENLSKEDVDKILISWMKRKQKVR